MTVIAINTLAYHGYPLDTALEEISHLTRAVEPVFISKYDPALDEAYFNESNARKLRRRLEELHLQVPSMGSHMDLGKPNAVDAFKRRMEFAQAIGARVILTNASSQAQQETLYRNVEALAALAEKLDLVAALENPGDGQGQLLGTGTDGVAVLRRLASDRIRLNYDFSNIWTYSRGTQRPEQELASVLPYVCHLHLKNVKPCRDAESCVSTWAVCGLDEGIIDYRRLFRQFPALSKIPMSIELPIRFGYDAEFRFGLQQELGVLSLGDIRKVLKKSLDYVVAAVTP